MLRHKTMARVRAALLAATAAAVLAGCSADPIIPEAAMAVSDKTNQVSWQVERHEVRFDLGSERVASGELGELDRFLAPYYDDTGLYVYVDPAPALAGGAVAARREAVLRRFLGERGFAARPISADVAARPSPDPRVATVYVGRFVVSLPRCPDWRKMTAADFTNTPSSNFGCSDAVNLGLMLADPGDLVRGRIPGPAEAERLAIGVQRYREGPPLKGSKSGGGTSGEAGGSGVSTTGGDK